MTGFPTRLMLILALLLAATSRAQTQTKAQRFPPFDPERIFILGDADLDGRLSLEEYRDFLRSSPRMRGAAASIEPMFRRLDTDRDGFLSMAEYRKSFPQRPGGASAKPIAPKEEQPVAEAGVGITPEQERFFEAKIRPVLVTQCGKCHASTAEKLRAGLRLDSREGLRLGGDSGPAIVPGQPDESLLLLRDPLRRRRPPHAAQGETPGRGRRGLRGLDPDGRPRPADRAGPGARGAAAGRSREEP